MWTKTLSCLLTMKNLCLFDPTLHFFGQHFALSVAPFCGQIRILQINWANYWKPIYHHFSNYRQIIDIDLRLLEIIGDFKQLSISLSLSKVPGKLSKKMTYRWPLLSLLAHCCACTRSKSCFGGLIEQSGYLVVCF